MKNRSGITLIALVVTIIVMIILAGVGVNLVLGQNGILQKAKQGKQNYLDAKELEEMQLNEVYDYLMTGQFPENTESTEEGTIVKLPTKWQTATPNYVSLEDGSITKKTEVASTVYAVAVGNGDTVPVPINFYYVGGTLSAGENCGVIISDNEADKYDGVTDKTTHEYAPNLKGNQFVWIPCSAENYKKVAEWKGTPATDLAKSLYDDLTNSVEKAQVEKYGGFYVGRYEAGTSEIQGVNFATIETSDWYTDEANYTKVTGGNITSKANEIPYYHADYETAEVMSERMYKNDNARNSYVSSVLMSGTMWDIMLKTMVEKTGCDPVEGSWGNYAVLEGEVDITGCRGMHCAIGSGGHGPWIAEDNYTKENRTDVMLTTGATSIAHKMHIYDVAGNAWEHTQEASFTAGRGIMRGGCCVEWYNSYPAAYRAFSDYTDTSSDLSFRVALYIK